MGILVSGACNSGVPHAMSRMLDYRISDNHFSECPHEVVD